MGPPPFLLIMSATAINYFYRPLRVVLGDWQGTTRAYTDAALLAAMQTVVQLGKLNNAPISASGGYSLSSDELSIEPEITNANMIALGTYHAAKLFYDPLPSSQSFRTRPMSRSWGSFARTLSTWEAQIYKVENGDMFDGYQNLYTWLAGMSGLPLASVLTEVDVNAPLWTAHVGIIS